MVSFKYLVNRLKHAAYHVAQFVNQHTHALDRFKNLFGIRRLVEWLITPTAPNNEEVKIIKSNLKMDVIATKVHVLMTKHISPIHYYVLCVENLGDIIAVEPISRRLKELSPTAKTHWIVRNPFVAPLEHNPYIDEIIPVQTLWDGWKLIEQESSRDDSVIVNCHFDMSSCSEKGTILRNPVNPQISIFNFYKIGNILDTFSLAAGLAPQDDSPIFYLRPNTSLPPNIPAHYVVFHCQSRDPSRNWTNEKWNTLASHLGRNGLNIVEIGTEKTLDKNLNIFDYTGRQDIHQLALIIKNATMFIGVDSAFAHIGNSMRTPSVVLFGKFMCYDTYFPYSGSFASSPDFTIIRAPKGLPASVIDIQEVEEVILGKIKSINKNLKSQPHQPPYQP